jgi:2-polyprenyl-3-methyl-5-hydroxy-6-metoxy-1,4-benzoquinol methylase
MQTQADPDPGRGSAAQRARSASLRAAARSPIRDIVNSYDSRVIRSYSRVRFMILRQIFLEEIGQYLPRSGRVLDLGCGFGLFSLYFAAQAPARSILGIDADPQRIEFARLSAARLGLRNVEYRVADAMNWQAGEKFDAIYLLDLVHHLPRDRVPAFLRKLRGQLDDAGILVLKEVEDRPFWKRWFTLALDRLMVGMEPIHYWPAAELVALLESLGFQVVRHQMKDVLPYPHILYVNRLPDGKLRPGL